MSRVPLNMAVPPNEAEVWNAEHRPGIDVEYRLDDGAVKRTKTTSEAWMLSGHTAVILLAGVSGCYRLDRVTPV